MSAAASLPQSDPPPSDERYMALAWTLGQRGLGNAWPNPAVGAVIVKDGIILARGWTQPGGKPHAEIEALRRAKKEAQGATMYVTLEPCSHHGKTPPCADAIIKAGIARVVSAMEDLNPKVAGQGHKRLTEKGIKVDVGIGADEAHRTHAGHIVRVRDGRPFVTLKLAISADGKVGLAGRQPVAISGEEGRQRVFQMRARSDAILVGINTVLSDNPHLTSRLPGLEERSPVRVVLDAQLRVPMVTAVVATVRETPTWVFGGHKASAVAEEVLRQRGCEVFRVAEKNGRLDLVDILKTLGAQGIMRLMVEGGPTVAASFVDADLVDEAVLLRAEKTIGDDGIDALEGMPLTALTQSPHLKARASERIGTDTIDTFERT
jgi:diaminohydroxyphosphoribosylaminopyrimidine deaminase / 5-amino-6-(5-phosphoribosylamino)uracil reductase